MSAPSRVAVHAAKVITSGWCQTAAEQNAAGGSLKCDVDVDAAGGDLIPALARLCLKIARRRAAAQKSEPAGD
jgi:hypothetical protein